MDVCVYELTEAYSTKGPAPLAVVCYHLSARMCVCSFACEGESERVAHLRVCTCTNPLLYTPRGHTNATPKHVRICAHIRTSTQVYTHTYTHAYAHTYTLAPTYTYAPMHTNTHVCTHGHTPLHTRTPYTHTYAYTHTGKLDAARRFFHKATSLDPQSVPSWILFGHSFACMDESDQAMAAYRTAARLFVG